MARMIRKQVYIEAGHDRALKRRAKQLGVTESELIRRGIEQIAIAPIVVRPDRQAWEAEKRFIAERMRMKVPQTGRQWTREELYEERLGRFSR